jgi:hypothetical protein
MRLYGKLNAILRKVKGFYAVQFRSANYFITIKKQNK